MTLLTLAQDILKETKASSIPTTIIGNNQDSAKQVLQALKISIKDLARSYEWQELQKEHTFTGVVSQNNYSLPTDFDRFINRTFWNTSNNREVFGTTTAKDWRFLNNNVNSGSIEERYRIRANEILIYPTPTATDNYIVEYISSYIVNSSGGSGQTDWQADTDVPNIDDYIVRLDATWRLLNMQGRPYAEKQRERDLALAERVGANSSKETIYHNYNSGYNNRIIKIPNNIGL